MLGTGHTEYSYLYAKYLIRHSLAYANSQEIPKLEAGARCGVIADIGAFASGLSERGMQGDEMLPENTHIHSSLRATFTTASFGVADNSATYL